MLRETMTSTMPVVMIGDGGRLNREVPQVSRGEEPSVGQDVERDPHDGERNDHAQDTDVDLQAGQRGASGSTSRVAGERGHGARLRSSSRLPE